MGFFDNNSYVELDKNERDALKEGDEFYIQTSWGFVKGIYPSVVWQDSHSMFCKGKTDLEIAKETPFFKKEIK